MEEVWGGGFEEGVNPALEYLDHLQVRLQGASRCAADAWLMAQWSWGSVAC